jgi:hypothetical protein
VKSILKINFEECGTHTSLEVVRPKPSGIDDIVATLHRVDVSTKTIHCTLTAQGCVALIRLTEQNGLPLNPNRASEVLRRLSLSESRMSNGYRAK